MGSPRRRGREFPQPPGALHGHDRARSGRRRGLCDYPKGYGIKAFSLGSAGQVKPTQIRNPDAFVYLHPGDVDTLDPDYAYDSLSFAPLSQIYEALVFYRGSSLTQFDPILATEVPSRANGGISADGLSGVAFSSSSPKRSCAPGLSGNCR